MTAAASTTGVTRYHIAVQKTRAGVYCISFLMALVGLFTGVLKAKLGLSFIVGMLGLLSAAIAIWLIQRGRFQILGIPLTGLWLATDVVLVTAAAYLAGGVNGPWFIWYLANSAAAAFVAGRKGAAWVSTANAIAYLTMLFATGQIHLFDVGFRTAMFQIGFLYAATFFFLRGVANLQEKRMVIKQLQEAESRKVAELTTLTEELNRKSEELANANQKISEADRMKSQFLANMSHELRTPLNSIIGFSEILVERLRGNIEDKHVSFLNHILSSGKHLLGIINDILDLSKIEAGKIELVPERFDAREAIEAVCSIMRAQAEKSGVHFDVDAPDLPDIEGDQAKFKQILYNLLSNAVKFSPADSTVKIAARHLQTPEAPPGGWLEVAVTDQGIGIAEEHHDIVFQEFRQVDSSSRKEFGGTGLGLALVRKFLEIQHGTIELASELGKGSTFTFRLPMNFEGLRLDSTPVFADVTPRGQVRGERVLVIEDDAIAYEALSRHLESAAYIPIRARHGDEALRLARLTKPVAITLDLVLPGESGWEVLKKLKADQETCEIPVVIVSMMDNRELGMALGAHDYFVKPVDRRRLLDRIKQLSARRRAGASSAIRLLLIDDDAAFHDLIDNEMRALGFDVTRAISGEVGIKLAEQVQPDIILLDLMMPGMSGFEVAERLKQNQATAHIPIVVMTAKEVTNADREELRNKISALLPKGSAMGSRLIAAIQELGAR